jgi:hypothetical protein
MRKMILGFIMALTVMANAFSQTEADFSVGLTADGEGVVIRKYIGTITQVRIPATIENMPVKEIGDSAFGHIRTITSVVIPDGVTTIGVYAFGYCSRLESITIPDSVTSIRLAAFAGSGLKSVTWPAGVTEIYPGESTLNGMFGNCKNLESVIIPEGITKIGHLAFSGCSALTSVTLPSTIIEIGGAAFYNCSSLTTVTIPDAVGNISFPPGRWVEGNSSFNGCLRLTLAGQAALRRRGYTGNF